MIRLKSVESTMNEIYQRVVQNKPFDKNLKIYSKEKIEEVLSFFEKIEDYEKCHKLKLFIKERFNH